MQTRLPDRVIVVARRTDTETLDELERLAKLGLDFQLVAVDRAGQAAAIEAGVAACSEQIVAHVDDDTAPSEGWLEGLLSHYRDGVGGVGGRDIVGGGDAPGTRENVGRITWYGRQIGNHHIGAGSAREVDVLKNANISLRRELWVCDPAVRGIGAQTHLELAICLRARSLGWRLVYDPSVTVDHFPAPRYDGDGRGARPPEVTRDVAFNATYAMVRYLPLHKLAFAVPYAFLVGNRVEPGPVLLLETVLRRRSDVSRQLASFSSATLGRASGVLAGGRTRFR